MIANLSDRLELIKKRAGRIITGAILRNNTEILYSELGWTSLKERQKSNCLCLLHKTVIQSVPLYLQECLPNIVGNRSRYLLKEIEMRLKIWAPE